MHQNNPYRGIKNFSGGAKRHTAVVEQYFSNPDMIEKGFKPIFKEFGTGNFRRIDIRGVDGNRNLCIGEIKTRRTEGYEKQIKNYEKQVKDYRSALNRLFRALNLHVPIRIIVITPEAHLDMGCSRSFDPKQSISIPKGIPSSREIFGLKR